MKRIPILNIILCLFGSLHVAGQTADSTRVMELPSFELIAHRWYSETLSPEQLDSSSISIREGESITAALNKAGSNFIRSYGPGRLTNYSIEGATTGQSLVLWNGVPVQNPMNAYTDISLFENANFDRIQQKNTSNYSQFGNGAMVSSVSFLNQKPDRDKSVGAFLEAGSFKSVKSGLSFGKKKDKYVYQSSITYQNTASDYPYTLADGSRKRMENAENSSLNLQFNAWANGKGTKTRALHLWAHSSDKNIPSPFAAVPSQQFQRDQFIQLLYKQSNTQIRKKQLIHTFYYQANLNRYQNRLSDLETDNIFHSLSYELKYNYNSRLNAGLKQQVNSANTAAYQGARQIWISSLFAQVNAFDPNKTFQLFGGVRSEWSNQAGASLGGNISMSYRFTPKIDLALHADRTFRYPSLNDLYWLPGGNEELQSEKGLSQKLILSVQTKQHYLQLKAFNRLTENLILWIPQGGIWEAQNIQSVWARGLDITGNTHVLHSLKNELNIRYKAAWTKSTNRDKTSANDRSQGKQLIYIPEFTAAYFLDLRRKEYALSFSQNFSSRIFTSRDNSSYLDGYTLLDLSLSKQFKRDKSLWTLALDLRNLMDKDYKLSLGWPMPGRGIYLKLNYQNQ